MLLKTFLFILLPIFVFFKASADQNGLSLLSQTNAPQSQIEWFIDPSQGSSWTLNLKGQIEQLLPKKGFTGISNYKARVTDKSTGQSVIDWQGYDGVTFNSESRFYFLLFTSDANTVALLQSPNDSLEVEISYQALKGNSIVKTFNHKISLKNFCETQSDKVLQPFSGEMGCFHSLSQAAISGKCTKAESDTYCNSAFREKRSGIEQKLGCDLVCI